MQNLSLGAVSILGYSYFFVNLFLISRHPGWEPRVQTFWRCAQIGFGVLRAEFFLTRFNFCPLGSFQYFILSSPASSCGYSNPKHCHSTFGQCSLTISEIGLRVIDLSNRLSARTHTLSSPLPSSLLLITETYLKKILGFFGTRYLENGRKFKCFRVWYSERYYLSLFWWGEVIRREVNF